MPPHISVIIVNYNAGDRLQKCLDHLAAQTFTDFEVLVVDNASVDTSLEAARAHPLTPQILAFEDNLGFAEGNNRAAAVATGEWLAFLNPDAYARADWLEQLVAATERYPNVDAFGSTQVSAEHQDILDGAGDAYGFIGIPYRSGFGKPLSTLPPEGECFAPCAAAAMYKANIFRQLNGFDSRFFCYGEDVDLGFRLRLQGGHVIQVKDAVVLHEGSGITGRHSDFSVYHGHRNRIWTYYKNMPAWLLWPMLPLHLLFNVYLFFRFLVAGAAPAYLRGLTDAVKRLGQFREDRRAMAKHRKASINQIARTLTWSPLAIWQRKPKIWPPK